MYMYIYIFIYQCKVHRGLLWGVGVHIFIFRLTNRLSQSDYLAQRGLGQPFIVYIYIYTYRLSQSDYLAQHGLGQPFIVYIYIYISTESVELSCTTWAGSALHSIHIYIYLSTESIALCSLYICICTHKYQARKCLYTRAWDNPVNICIYTMPRNVDQGLGRKYECTCIYIYIFIPM